MQINFTNESNIATSTKDFIFISYSHCDSDVVFDCLKVLDENNMNYWVDKELLSGDKWDETVLNVIDNANCKGAILFLSPDYLKSEAAEKEIEYCFEKKKKGEFTIGIISLNNRSVLGNVCLVFNSLQNVSDKEIQSIFPQERVYTITKYLEKNIIYTPNLKCCDSDAKKKFFDNFNQYASSVFDNSKLYHKMLAEKMSARNVDGINEIQFGICPMVRTDAGGILLCEGYNFIDGKYVYKRREQTYLAQSINWKVVDANENEVVLLSDKALFHVQPSVLSRGVSEHVPIKFEDKYLPAVKEIKLFNIEDEERLNLLFKNCFEYTEFAQDSKNKPFPDVFIFDGIKKVAYNKMLKKLQFPIMETNFGYIYPCLKLETKKLLSLED